MRTYQLIKSPNVWNIFHDGFLYLILVPWKSPVPELAVCFSDLDWVPRVDNLITNIKWIVWTKGCYMKHFRLHRLGPPIKAIYQVCIFIAHFSKRLHILLCRRRRYEVSSSYIKNHYTDFPFMLTSWTCYCQGGLRGHELYNPYVTGISKWIKLLQSLHSTWSTFLRHL